MPCSQYKLKIMCCQQICLNNVWSFKFWKLNEFDWWKNCRKNLTLCTKSISNKVNQLYVNSVYRIHRFSNRCTVYNNILYILHRINGKICLYLYMYIFTKQKCYLHTYFIYIYICIHIYFHIVLCTCEYNWKISIYIYLLHWLAFY